MKKFHTDIRIQATSTPEITDALEEAIFRLSRRLKYDGRKMKSGHLINALALHFLDLPPGEQEQLADQMLRRLERFMGEDGKEGAGEPLFIPETQHIEPSKPKKAGKQSKLT